MKQHVVDKLIGLYVLTVMAVAAWAVGRCVRGCQAAVEPTPAPDTVRTVLRDTVVLLLRDTVPLLRRERVVQYVPLPASPPAAAPAPQSQAAADSLPVVQREYTDDSTYTAYVSGPAYASWPRLDSIRVRRVTVSSLVRETVTRPPRPHSRWSVGIQAGYGYGLRYGGPEPYVGVGVSFRIH